MSRKTKPKIRTYLRDKNGALVRVDTLLAKHGPFRHPKRDEVELPQARLGGTDRTEAWEQGHR